MFLLVFVLARYSWFLHLAAMKGINKVIIWPWAFTISLRLKTNTSTCTPTRQSINQVAAAALAATFALQVPDDSSDLSQSVASSLHVRHNAQHPHPTHGKSGPGASRHFTPSTIPALDPARAGNHHTAGLRWQHSRKSPGGDPDYD